MRTRRAIVYSSATRDKNSVARRKMGTRQSPDARLAGRRAILSAVLRNERETGVLQANASGAQSERGFPVSKIISVASETFPAFSRHARGNWR